MRFRPCALLLLVLPATFVSAQTLTPPASAATGRWLTDYAQARAESRRLNMPLLVHFSATWCGPCQAMERETLNKPAVTQSFGRDVIGVKLDFDRDRGLADAFRVKSVPADIVVAPDGKIIGRHSGKQKPVAYTAALKHWGSQFERPAAESSATAHPLPLASPRPFAIGPVRPSTSPQRVVRQPVPLQTGPPQAGIIQPQPLGPAGPETPTFAAGPPAEQPPLIGLDGYSPVQITSHRQWTRGERKFAAIWQGVVYFLTSESEQQLFIATPQKYAPRLLGCDPVSLAESGRAVQGSVECGAFYDRHLYLFENKESRSRFKLSPEHFLATHRPLTAANVIGRRLY